MFIAGSIDLDKLKVKVRGAFPVQLPWPQLEILADRNVTLLNAVKKN